MDSKINNHIDNSLSIWRIVFTFVIMLFHLVNGTYFYEKYSMIKYHWYIAVEFFFILSGYLLMKHADSNENETCLEYIKNRVFRLYPEYIIAFSVMCCVRAYNTGLNIFKIIIPNWLELFMLHSVGTNTFPYINNPAWYVSALLIGSYFIYYLIKHHKQIYLYLIGPLGVVLIFGYMYREYERLENFYHTEGILGNTALLRAFMGLTIGVYAYLISEKYKNVRINKIVRSGLEVFLFAGILIFALLVEDGCYDFLFLPLFAIGIILASGDSMLGQISKNKIIRFLDKKSYTMYLSHFAAISFLGFFLKMSEMWKWWYIIIYILITVILSVIYSYFAEIIRKIIMNVGLKGEEL